MKEKDKAVLRAAFEEALKAADAQFHLSSRRDSIDLFTTEGRVQKKAGEDVFCSMSIEWTRRAEK